MTRKELLEQYLKAEIQKVEIAGGDIFLGHPDAWYEPYHCCCTNGHVSTSYLKSELKGNVCLSCFEPVYICPNISEEELGKILNP